MAKIATTKEQSDKLISLGLNVNTADMYYSIIDDTDELSEDNSLLYVNREVEWDEVPVYDRVCPAWSLSALIELIPNKISISDDLYYVCYKRNSAELRGPVTWNGHQKTKIFKADNILDAAFEMVCYLLENKLI